MTTKATIKKAVIIEENMQENLHWLGRKIDMIGVRTSDTNVECISKYIKEHELDNYSEYKDEDVENINIEMHVVHDNGTSQWIHLSENDADTIYLEILYCYQRKLADIYILLQKCSLIILK